MNDYWIWIKIWYYKNLICKYFIWNWNKYIIVIFEWIKYNINKFCDNCYMFNCFIFYVKELNFGLVLRYFLKILDILVSFLIFDFFEFIVEN